MIPLQIFFFVILHCSINTVSTQYTINFPNWSFHTELQWDIYEKPNEITRNNLFNPQSFLKSNYQSNYINTPTSNYNDNCECSCRKCVRPKPCCKALCVKCNNQPVRQGSYVLYPYPIPILIISNSTKNTTDTTKTSSTSTTTVTATTPSLKTSKTQLKLTKPHLHTSSTYIYREITEVNKVLTGANHHRSKFNKRNHYEKKQEDFMKLRPDDIIYIPRPTIKSPNRKMNNNYLMKNLINSEMSDDEIEILPIPDFIAKSILKQV